MARNAKRFARKYHVAQLLSARLFQGEKEAEELKNQVYQTEIYKSGDKRFTEILKQRVPNQQQWVRASFLCDGNATPELQRFIDVVVKPAISISTTSVPEQMVGVMGRYMSILTGSEASEQDVANMRIACSALAGELDQHPLVQGLIVCSCDYASIELELELSIL